MLPALTPQNRAFWTGGSSGQLRVQRCVTCRRWTHPPAELCGACGGSLHAEPVSGRGTVFTFTVNEHRFHPEVPAPNVIAIVQLDEQPDLRIVTNLVDCEPTLVRCGLAVEVLFEPHGEISYPLFRPILTTAAEGSSQ